MNLVDPPYTSILREPIFLITEQTRKRCFIYIQKMYIDPSMMMGTKVRRHYTSKIKDHNIKATRVQKQNLTKSKVPRK